MPTATDLRPATTAPKAPARFRAYGPKGLKAAAVDREKRVITGYAVITRGEALGSRAVEHVAHVGNPRSARSARSSGLGSLGSLDPATPPARRATTTRGRPVRSG